MERDGLRGARREVQLTTLFEAIDLPGTLVTVAVVLFAMYHLRRGLNVLSPVATWIYALAVAFALAVIASTGIIPGINSDPVVQVQTFLGWLGDVLRIGWDLLGGVPP